MASGEKRCSACIQLGWNCSPTCIFAPCFPQNRPNKFAIIHRAYGALNILNYLSHLPPEQRIAASDQLAHEASMYLRSVNNKNNDGDYRCWCLVNLDVREEEMEVRLGNVKDSVIVTSLRIEDNLPENPFNMERNKNYRPGESSGSK